MCIICYLDDPNENFMIKFFQKHFCSIRIIPFLTSKHINFLLYIHYNIKNSTKAQIKKQFELSILDS